MINFLVTSIGDAGQVVLKDKDNNQLSVMVSLRELVQKEIHTGDWVHFTRFEEIVKD